MLRQLFHSPGIIAFYSPEPATQWASRNGFTNCGEEMCLKSAKTCLIDVSVAYSIGKLYDFAVYRVVQRFFPGGIGLKMRFGVADSQIDALFRVNKNKW